MGSDILRRTRAARLTDFISVNGTCFGFSSLSVFLILFVFFLSVSPQTHSHADDQLVCDTHFFVRESGRSGGDLSGADVFGFGAWNIFLGGFFFSPVKQEAKYAGHTSSVLPDLPALPVSAHVPDSEDSELIFAKKFHPDLTAASC